MSKKRPAEENPPQPESEEEEEDEEGSEGESESTDDDNTPSAAAGHAKKALDSSDTESDSEPESCSGRSSPSASAFQLKPVTPQKIKKPTAPAAPIDSEAANGKKKSAGVSGGKEEEEEEVRKGVQGRWSESDEIALLNGMIQYKSERGSDPSSDMRAFLDYIEKSLQNKVNKSSLATKVRRLKQKYQSLAEKSKADGEYPVFSKPHEQKSFELSRKIWGLESEKSSEKRSKKSKSKSSSQVDNIGTLALPKQEPSSSIAPSAKKPRRVSNGEVNGDHKKKSSGSNSSLGNVEAERVAPKVEEEEYVKEGKMEEEEEKKKLCEKYPYLFESMQSVDEQIKKSFMNEVGKMDGAILKDWDLRWKKLNMAKMQLYVKQKSLIAEQAKEVLDMWSE